MDACPSPSLPILTCSLRQLSEPATFSPKHPVGPTWPTERHTAQGRPVCHRRPAPQAGRTLGQNPKSNVFSLLPSVLRDINFKCGKTHLTPNITCAILTPFKPAVRSVRLVVLRGIHRKLGPSVSLSHRGRLVPPQGDAPNTCVAAISTHPLAPWRLPSDFAAVVQSWFQRCGLQSAAAGGAAPRGRGGLVWGGVTGGSAGGFRGFLVSGGQKSTCFSNCINSDAPTTHPSLLRWAQGCRVFILTHRQFCSSITETRCR